MSIETKTRELAPLLGYSQALKQALRLDHEANYRIQKQKVNIIISIFGEQVNRAGTITEAGMVRNEYWHRHINTFASAVAEMEGWELIKITTEEGKVLWEGGSTK